MDGFSDYNTIYGTISDMVSVARKSKMAASSSQVRGGWENINYDGKVSLKNYVPKLSIYSQYWYGDKISC